MLAHRERLPLGWERCDEKDAEGWSLDGDVVTAPSAERLVPVRQKKRLSIRDIKREVDRARRYYENVEHLYLQEVQRRLRR